MRSLLAAAVGADHVLPAGSFPADYGHDEALGIAPGEPAFVVRPGSTPGGAAVLRAAGERGRAVTARGSGTGPSPGADRARGGGRAPVGGAEGGLYPRLPWQATVLAPFASLEQVTAAVPRIVASGLGPLILEYVDQLTMAAITASEDLDLGVPAAVCETALAYLVVMVEGRSEERLGADVEELAGQLDDLGAADVYVLPLPAARRLIEARERAFWTAKSAGAGDIVDAVVPRAAMAGFLAEVTEISGRPGGLVLGAGHAGDGNVHLAVFEPDPAARQGLLRGIFAAAVSRGGAVSGEHGIGSAKKSYFLEFADPVPVDLMRRVKQAFDPRGILGPGVTGEDS